MLFGFLPILREYEIEAVDTIFFSVVHKGESSVKIFRGDGMEIKYSKNIVEEGTTPETWLSSEKIDNIEVMVSPLTYFYGLQ